MSARVQRVAVLGGSRFIGKAIVETLLANGCQVTTVNRGQTPVGYPQPIRPSMPGPWPASTSMASWT
jgi:nucleoside-diphosphate-sugar epimerase